MADQTSVISVFFTQMGATAALTLCCLGSAYGTAKSSIGISAMGVMRPEQVMKNVIPVVMAGIISIYGLVIAITIATSPLDTQLLVWRGFRFFAAGLCVGIAGLSAGMSIGIVGDAGVRAVGQQPKMYVPMVLMLIFAEVLALYGLIVALIMVI